MTRPMTWAMTWAMTGSRFWATTARHGRRFVLVTLLLAAAWQGGDAARIALKAWLAQALLANAWACSEGGAQPIRPWPGADTWPAARLGLPRQGVMAIVLAGASPRNLAFGPAHVDASAWPGEGRASIIAGHRDTHFGALEHVARGDPVTLERRGREHRYEVVDTAVVHRDAAAIVAGADELVLVTCWPFRALSPGTPWRYVVRAAPRAAPGG